MFFYGDLLNGQEGEIISEMGVFENKTAQMNNICRE
jgi:hypothetical protein